MRWSSTTPACTPGTRGSPRSRAGCSPPTGLTVGEPEHARTRTWCCGGPAESLFPATALAVARQRVAQLRAVAPVCVTMCPICLVNLGKAAGGTIRLRDISDCLVEAAGPAAGRANQKATSGRRAAAGPAPRSPSGRTPVRVRGADPRRPPDCGGSATTRPPGRLRCGPRCHGVLLDPRAPLRGGPVPGRPRRCAGD